MVLFTNIVFGFIMRVWHVVHYKKKSKKDALESLEANITSDPSKISSNDSGKEESSDTDSVFSHPSHHEE